jgi:uncharacterized protein (DUF1778 family)
MPKMSNANTPPPKPARQLGRVSDEDWSLLKSAANAQRMTFTGWALGILLNVARQTMEKMQ